MGGDWEVILNLPLVHANDLTKDAFRSKPKQLKIASTIVRQEDNKAIESKGRLHFSFPMLIFPRS